MDFKDQIIFCLVVMVLAMGLILIWNSEKPKQEITPANNEIIYNVVDDDGHVIGGFILKK